MADANKGRRMATNAATSEGQPVLDTDALQEVLDAHRAAAEPAEVETGSGGENVGGGGVTQEVKQPETVYPEDSQK